MIHEVSENNYRNFEDTCNRCWEMHSVNRLNILLESSTSEKYFEKISSKLSVESKNNKENKHNQR